MEQINEFTLQNKCKGKIKIGTHDLDHGKNESLLCDRSYTVTWPAEEPSKNYSFNLSPKSLVCIEIEGPDKIKLKVQKNASNTPGFGFPSEPNDTVTIEDNEE